MNFRCTICEAILANGSATDRCPECGARSVFQIPTRESPRHAKEAAGGDYRVWEFSPDGPVLRRFR
jgi:phage FluMu protein Com